MVLLSFHALVVDPPNVPKLVVLQKNRAIQEFFPLSPMHSEYTIYMRELLLLINCGPFTHVKPNPTSDGIRVFGFS